MTIGFKVEVVNIRFMVKVVTISFRVNVTTIRFRVKISVRISQKYEKKPANLKLMGNIIVA